MGGRAITNELAVVYGWVIGLADGQVMCVRVFVEIKSGRRFIDMTGARRHFGSSYCANRHWLSPDLAFNSRAFLV